VNRKYCIWSFNFTMSFILSSKCFPYGRCLVEYVCKCALHTSESFNAVSVVIHPDLVQAFLKKWWVESDFKAPIEKHFSETELSKISRLSQSFYICTKEYDTRNFGFFFLLLQLNQTGIFKLSHSNCALTKYNIFCSLHNFILQFYRLA
jgi:hypothetical protein